MQEKQEIIIQYFREGKSQRAISKALKLNRKTVRKYIEKYQELEAQKSQLSLTAQVLTEEIISRPQYSRRQRMECLHLLLHKLSCHYQLTL